MSELTIEQQAKAQGWVPEEEFRGDLERWVDAETFVKRGEEIQPVLRERNREMAGEITQLRSDLKVVTSHIKNVEQRAYDRAKQEYEDKVQALDGEAIEAVQEGDTAKYQMIQTKKSNLKQPQEPKAEPQANPGFEPWVNQNPWYNTDIEMRSYAEMIGPGVAASLPPGSSDTDMYNRITEEVKKRFPYKFENPKKNKQTVEGDTAEPVSKTGGKKFGDLPAAAKKSYERMRKNFEMQGHQFTKEDYLAEYDWS